MAIIDRKGRLFNKINLLDLTIILFIIFAASLIFINKASCGKLTKKISDLPELEYVQIDIILPEDLAWIKKYVNAGDAWQGSFHGHSTAQVLEAREVDGFGQNKRLLVKLKAFVSKDNLGALSFGKYTLRIGEEIIFYTPKYIFKGHIVNINMTGEKIRLKD